MIRVFNLKEDTRYRITTSKSDLIKRQVTRNFELMHERYYNASLFVPNSSIEVRLLRQFCPNVELSLETFILEAKSRVNDACRLLGIGSYGSTCVERYETNFSFSSIFIHRPLDINLIIEYDNILSQSAIKYIYHDSGDISFGLPKDSDISSSILIIDPVVLMLQYKKWHADRTMLNLSSTITIFCGTFLQLSVLPTLITMSYFNICTGTSPINHKHNVSVMDIEPSIVGIAKVIKDRSLSGSFSISGLLNIIPTITGGGFYDYIFEIKPGLLKRDSRWASDFFFLNVLGRLNNIMSGGTIRRNSRYFKSLKRAIKIATRTGVTSYGSLTLKDIYDGYLETLG